MIESNLAGALYLPGLLLAGYGLMTPFKNLSRLERLGFAACLGPGAIGLCLIGISMLGYPPSRSVILILISSFGLMTFQCFTRPAALIPIPASPVNALWRILGLAAILFAISRVGFQAVFQQTIEWDAYAIWQLKAKLLATTALTPRPAYFTDVSLSYSHLRYPILMSMISASVHVMTGTLNDGLEKVPAILLLVGLCACVYGAIFRRRGSGAALTATALLLTTPTLLKFAGSGTAELAIAAFYACSIAAILRWQEQQKIADLLLAAFFSACLAWTKNEGLALAVVNLVIILFATPRPLLRRHLTSAALFGAIIAMLYLPWFLYTHELPRTDEDYAGHLNVTRIVANIDRLPRILWAMLMETFNLARWGIFWVILLPLAILEWKQLQTRPVLTLIALLALQTTSYVVAYLVTPLDVDHLIMTTSYRLLLHASPVGALLVGMLWPPSARKKPVPLPTGP